MLLCGDQVAFGSLRSDILLNWGICQLGSETLSHFQAIYTLDSQEILRLVDNYPYRGGAK